MGVVFTDEQGESRQLACPLRLDLPNAAIGRLDPRHAEIQKALVLEEIELA